MKVIKTQIVELKLSGGMRRYFDSLKGRADILPKRLNQVYHRISYYQRVLAKIS